MFERYTSDLKHSVLIISLVTVAAFGILCVICFQLNAGNIHRGWEYTAIVLFGAACGWALGTVVSPNNQLEEKRFTGIGATVGSFLTGYVFSKADDLIENLLKIDTWKQGDVATCFMLWTTSLLLLTMYVYIMRAYLLPRNLGYTT